MTSPVTAFLKEIHSEDLEGWNEVLPLIYGELRAHAKALLNRSDRKGAIEPTSLAHEAWAKLCKDRRFESREHFLAVAAVAMRGILVDQARERAALKRGGDQHGITLHSMLAAGKADGLDLVDLDDTLRELSELDPRRARVVELRVFGGLKHEEIAKVIGVSLSSVEADWRLARAWLSAHLNDGTSK